MPAEHRRVLVIGAGPTGLGAATRLHELGEDFLVVDSGEAPGGLARTQRDDAGFGWDLGGHVVHSHFDEFDAAVARSAVSMRAVMRGGRVVSGGRWSHTPVQQQLDAIPGDLRPGAPAANLAEHYRNEFGADLCRRFFEPFTRKMWATPLEQVDHAWTSHRSGSAAANVPRVGLARDQRAVVETFPYPEGGTGALWAGIAARLPAPVLRPATTVTGLDLRRRVATLTSADGRTGEVAYEHCVSAMPLDRLLALTADGSELPWPAGVTAGVLRTARVTVVGLGFEGPTPDHLADVTYMYSPDPDVPWYRATVLSNYDPSLAGAGRWSLLLEVASAPERPTDPGVGARVVASLPALGVGAAPVSTTSVTLERGYPVPVLGRDPVLRAVDRHLVAHGVRSRGRFGGWRYESCNQDYAFVQGIEAVDAAVGPGSREDVYWRPESF